MLERLRGGEAADIAILTAQGIDDLIAEGIILRGTRTDMARSFVGIAVKAGAPKPDIGTVDAFTGHCWPPAQSPIPGLAPAASSSPDCSTGSASPLR